MFSKSTLYQSSLKLQSTWPSTCIYVWINTFVPELTFFFFFTVVLIYSYVTNLSKFNGFKNYWVIIYQGFCRSEIWELDWVVLFGIFHEITLSCCLGLWSPEGSPGTREAKSKVVHSHSGKVVLAQCPEPQLLSMWNLSLLMTLWLNSSRRRNSKDLCRSYNAFHDLASHDTITPAIFISQPGFCV